MYIYYDIIGDYLNIVVSIFPDSGERFFFAKNFFTLRAYHHTSSTIKTIHTYIHAIHIHT